MTYHIIYDVSRVYYQTYSDSGSWIRMKLFRVEIAVVLCHAVTVAVSNSDSESGRSQSRNILYIWKYTRNTKDGHKIRRYIKTRYSQKSSPPPLYLLGE